MGLILGHLREGMVTLRAAAIFVPLVYRKKRDRTLPHPQIHGAMASPAQMARLRAAVDARMATHVRGDTVWVGYPGIKVRDGQGNLTPAGQTYEELLAARGNVQHDENTRNYHPGAVPVMRNGRETIAAAGTRRCSAGGTPRAAEARATGSTPPPAATSTGACASRCTSPFG